MLSVECRLSAEGSGPPGVRNLGYLCERCLTLPCTKSTNQHDFRERNTRFVLRNSFFARKTRIYTISASGRHDASFDSCPKNRVIDLSISCHSCHSCYKRIGGDLSISYHSCLKIVPKKNRDVDLSISYHSCLKNRD